MNRPFLLFLAHLFLMGSVIQSNTQSKTYTLLVLGDSLTEGFGVNEEEAFPAQLENLFLSKGFTIKIINGGSSGSTSASGISKLKWYAKAKPDAVVIALGSNDGLRGVPLSSTQTNLEKIIEFAQNKEWQVFLAGLQIPPNYGPEYTEGFKKIYPGLAKKFKLPLLPFLLKDVAGEPDKNLVDGIHPNAQGHKIMANNMFEFLSPFILKTNGEQK